MVISSSSNFRIQVFRLESQMILGKLLRQSRSALVFAVLPEVDPKRLDDADRDRKPECWKKRLSSIETTAFTSTGGMSSYLTRRRFSRFLS